MPPIPITIITGFLGSGKTTILLHLIPQLPPNYRLALLKNEFGDIAVDSQLATTKSISGVRELLNGCICCNLVGQLGDALIQLRDEMQPDRIVIETSGSAFPATLAMEVNRLSREHGGAFILDGVIGVIDVENWNGYDDTSYTAKLQAKYTDLVVFNKWEGLSDQRFDICLDRLGDLEVPTPWVKSDQGRVDKDILLGIDGALLSKESNVEESHLVNGHSSDHDHSQGHSHQSEVEVLSVSLNSTHPDDSISTRETVKLSAFENLLTSASKEEVYRIKGIIRFSAATALANSEGQRDASIQASNPDPGALQEYILNWAFGRWTFTPCSANQFDAGTVARLTFILARYESYKWKKRLEAGGLVEIESAASQGKLSVERLV